MNSQFEFALVEKIGLEEPGVAIAVARAGELIHASAHGSANMECGQKNDLHTTFRIGSLTKQFTAIALFMLQDRGLLSIEQPITKFISGAPADYRNITISHLLNHTAGVPNYTDIPGFWAQHSARDVTPSEATDYFMSLPLDFAPGERFNYSNSGYLLLGRVIEAVAQCRYGEFLQNEIFRPLEMDDTSYLANAPATKQSASGYVLRAGTFQNAAIMSMTWPHASGALGSSVLDLVKWQIALSSGKLVSRNTLTVMHQPTILNDGSQSSYGFGWMIGDRGGQRYPHHSGSINGFASHMAWFPEGDVTVAVLSNLVSFPATNLGDKLAHAAFLVD